MRQNRKHKMNRRGFMKLLTAPLLIGLTKPEKKPEPDFCADCQCKVMDGCNCKEKCDIDDNRIVGIAMQDIPKGKFGWVRIQNRPVVGFPGWMAKTSGSYSESIEQKEIAFRNWKRYMAGDQWPDGLA